MASLYDELVSNLNEQIGYYNELFSISREKTQVIIKNDIENLGKINTVENMLVVRLEKLDKKTTETMKSIVMVTGKELERITVKNVAKLLSSTEGAELEELANKIYNVMIDIKEVNSKNKILVDTSLEYAEFSMNIYRNMLDPNISVTYDKNGNM